MTIDNMLQLLTEMQRKYGGHVPVYFDCPKCEVSFTPDKLQLKSTVHITAGDKKCQIT